MIALQALDESHNERAVEVCVFAVTFFGPAPTRVAPEIGVGRSDHDSALVVFGTLKDVPRLVSFDGPGLFEQLHVPRFAEADSLLKRRARHGQRPAPFAWSTLSQAVNAFDVAARLDAKPRYAGIRVE